MERLEHMGGPLKEPIFKQFAAHFKDGWDIGGKTWREFICSEWTRWPLTPGSAVAVQLRRRFPDAEAFERWTIAQFLSYDRAFAPFITALCDFCARRLDLVYIKPAAVTSEPQWSGVSWLRKNPGGGITILIRMPENRSRTDVIRGHLAVLHELGHLFDNAYRLSMKDGMGEAALETQELFAHAFMKAAEFYIFVSHAWYDAAMCRQFGRPHDNALYDVFPPPDGYRWYPPLPLASAGLRNPQFPH